MGYISGEIVRRIPSEKKNALQEKLLEILLSSARGEFLPISVVKRLLYLYENDLLFSDAGFKSALEGALILERQKVVEAFLADPDLLYLRGALEETARET